MLSGVSDLVVMRLWVEGVPGIECVAAVAVTIIEIASRVGVRMMDPTGEGTRPRKDVITGPISSGKGPEGDRPGSPRLTSPGPG